MSLEALAADAAESLRNVLEESTSKLIQLGNPEELWETVVWKSDIKSIGH